jgi:predicted transcriptional regulator
MDTLQDNDFKVLIRIDRKLLEKDTKKIAEFPYLTKEQINEALDKLKNLGLIQFDDGTNMWSVTYEGQQLLLGQEQFLNDFIDEYLASLA